MLNKLLGIILLVIGISLAFGNAHAIDETQVPQEKRSTLGLYFTSKEASEQMDKHGNSTLLMDVRDPAEIHTVGMPTVVDANVPFKFINLKKWDAKKSRFVLDNNPNFSAEVAQRLKGKGLSKNDTIIVICGSGIRAPKAVNALATAGYKNVYAVIDGYAGWQKENLSWSRKLDRDKMHGNPVGGK